MRIARSTGAISGMVIIVLGAWGAISPFIGPYFGYAFGRDETWHYTTDRLWLSILPGALAVIAGLLLLIAARRATGALGGWLGTLAGGWFAIGPAVSLTWENGPGPIGQPLYGTTRQMIELVGSFYGVGALIVAFAAFAIGRFASRPHVDDEAVIARAARSERAEEPPARTPAAESAAPEAGRPRAARGRRLPFGRGRDGEGRRSLRRGREGAREGGGREVRDTPVER
jgi:hypothetical protein